MHPPPPHPAVVPYRQTFLRRHIHNELHPKPHSDGRLREEVLALDNLRYRLGQAFPGLGGAVIRSAVTLSGFFYGGDRGVGTHSDVRLYLEVPVTRISLTPLGAAQEGKEPSAWRELSQLLREDGGAPPGVVLRARSGAGKTTAMLKAFHDCLFSAEGPPLLAGRLPCYLRDLTAGSPPIRQALKKDAAGLVERMVLHAAGWPGATPKMVKSWLRWSRPLLIFLDLNTAAEDVAVLLSQALPAFQQRWARQGHRCVVAYRSFGQDDAYSNLRNLAGFAFYDLQPLPYGLARRYLQHLAAYETWLRERLTPQTGIAADDTAAEYDLALLERLARQHVRGADGVLSTPLLVHLFSLLRGEQQQRVHCLADLYHEVVEEYLDREYGHLEGRPRKIDAPAMETPYGHVVSGSGFQTAKGRRRLKTALVRVAFAILGAADGEASQSTRLQRKDLGSDEVLDALLADPETAKRWCPAEPDWHSGEYFTIRLNKKERAAVAQSSLLRLDNAGYGFLHDSFLYYFAALGLRCRTTPTVGLSPLGGDGSEEPWFGLAARRMHTNPARWWLPAEFVGGLLTWEELAVLTREILAATPRPGWPDLLLNLARGRRRPEGTDDPLLAGVERALVHKLPGLFDRLGEDTALVSAVYHYLRDAARLPPERQGWLELLLRRLRAGGSRWLCSAEPTSWPSPVLRAHRKPVTCVAVLDDGRVVSGDMDGQVIVWDQETGHWQGLYYHADSVNAVAVSGDGRVIVSGGDDRCVRRAVDGVADPVPLLRHKREVAAVAVSGDGRIVISGGDDGQVRRAMDGVIDPVPLLRHDRGVTAVAVSGEGRIVVSGGYDGCVRRSVDGAADPVPLLQHTRTAAAVAVSGDGRLIISGGDDGCVRRAVDGAADPVPLLQHEGSVYAVAVSADGRVIVSGGDDRCVRRAVDGVGDPVPLLQHAGWVRAVAVSGDGRIVVSGGDDAAIRLWFADDSRPLVYLCNGAIRSLSMTPDGLRMVATLDNGEVLTLDLVTPDGASSDAQR